MGGMLAGRVALRRGVHTIEVEESEPVAVFFPGELVRVWAEALVGGSLAAGVVPVEVSSPDGVPDLSVVAVDDGLVLVVDAPGVPVAVSLAEIASAAEVGAPAAA